MLIIYLKFKSKSKILIFNFYDIIEQWPKSWRIDLSLVRTDGKTLGNKNYFYKCNKTRKYILEIIKDPMNAIKTKKELDKFITLNTIKRLKSLHF